MNTAQKSILPVSLQGQSGDVIAMQLELSFFSLHGKLYERVLIRAIFSGLLTNTLADQCTSKTGFCGLGDFDNYVGLCQVKDWKLGVQKLKAALESATLFGVSRIGHYCHAENIWRTDFTFDGKPLIVDFDDLKRRLEQDKNESEIALKSMCRLIAKLHQPGVGDAPV